MVEKILHKDEIFGNLKGEIISEEEGISLSLVRDNYEEDEQPYMKMSGVEAVKGLRDYLNKAIFLMEYYRGK